MVNQDRTPYFVAVTCPCGRELRAKFDQVGSEIRCWDCHKMVPVPLPQQGQRVARELSDGAMVVIKGPGLRSVAASAAFITAILAIPLYGNWCSILALTLAASVYGEMIRRVSRGASEEPDLSWIATLLPRSPVKVLLCAAIAFGTASPLWIMNLGHRDSPHLDWRGTSILVATWFLLPILMFFAYARDDDRRLAIKPCLSSLIRHPMATLLSLGVVPIFLGLLEATMDLALYIPGNLPFFALDFMPMPRLPHAPLMYVGIPHYDMVDYRSYPESHFLAAYFRGLAHGYSFVGAIPASLSNDTRAGMNPEAIGWFDFVYTIVRVFITFLIVLCLLTAFAIQARWLGAIPALDRRRNA